MQFSHVEDVATVAAVQTGLGTAVVRLGLPWFLRVTPLLWVGLAPMTYLVIGLVLASWMIVVLSLRILGLQATAWRVVVAGIVAPPAAVVGIYVLAVLIGVSAGVLQMTLAPWPPISDAAVVILAYAASTPVVALSAFAVRGLLRGGDIRGWRRAAAISVCFVGALLVVTASPLFLSSGAGIAGPILAFGVPTAALASAAALRIGRTHSIIAPRGSATQNAAEPKET